MDKNQQPGAGEKLRAAVGRDCGPGTPEYRPQSSPRTSSPDYSPKSLRLPSPKPPDCTPPNSPPHSGKGRISQQTCLSVPSELSLKRSRPSNASKSDAAGGGGGANSESTRANGRDDADTDAARDKPDGNGSIQSRERNHLQDVKATGDLLSSPTKPRSDTRATVWAFFRREAQSHEERYTTLIREWCLAEFVRVYEIVTGIEGDEGIRLDRDGLVEFLKLEEDGTAHGRLEEECRSAYRALYWARCRFAAQIVDVPDANINGRTGIVRVIEDWNEEDGTYRVEIEPTKKKRQAKREEFAHVRPEHLELDEKRNSNLRIGSTSTGGNGRKKKGKGKKANKKTDTNPVQEYTIRIESLAFDMGLVGTISTSVLDLMNANSSDLEGVATGMLQRQKATPKHEKEELRALRGEHGRSREGEEGASASTSEKEPPRTRQEEFDRRALEPTPLPGATCPPVVSSAIHQNAHGKPEPEPKKETSEAATLTSRASTRELARRAVTCPTVGGSTATTISAQPSPPQAPNQQQETVEESIPKAPAESTPNASQLDVDGAKDDAQPDGQRIDAPQDKPDSGGETIQSRRAALEAEKSDLALQYKAEEARIKRIMLKKERDLLKEEREIFEVEQQQLQEQLQRQQQYQQQLQFAQQQLLQQQLQQLQKKNETESSNLNVIDLNIGGRLFSTTSETLLRGGSYFRNLVDQYTSGKAQVDKDGRIFIDRRPDSFPAVLDFLRQSCFNISDLSDKEIRKLRTEALYYELEDLVRITTPRIPLEYVNHLSHADGVIRQQAQSLREALDLGLLGASAIADKCLVDLFASGKCEFTGEFDRRALGSKMPLLFSNATIDSYGHAYRGHGDTSHRYADDNPRAPCSIDDFRKNLIKFGGPFLDGMDLTNLVIGGGVVLRALMDGDEQRIPHDTTADIDCYVVAEDEETAQGVYNRVLKHLATRVPQDEMTEGSTQKSIFGESRGNVVSHNELLVVRSKFAVTFCAGYPQRHIQLILRRHSCVADVLLRSDIDCCQVAYTGDRVVATPAAQRALKTGINIADPERSTDDFEVRLEKYARRGFAVAVPGMDRDVQDRWSNGTFTFLDGDLKRVHLAFSPGCTKPSFTVDPKPILGLPKLIVLSTLRGHPTEYDLHKQKCSIEQESCNQGVYHGNPPPHRPKAYLIDTDKLASSLLDPTSFWPAPAPHSPPPQEFLQDIENHVLSDFCSGGGPLLPFCPGKDVDYLRNRLDTSIYYGELQGNGFGPWFCFDYIGNVQTCAETPNVRNAKFQHPRADFHDGGTLPQFLEFPKPSYPPNKRPAKVSEDVWYTGGHVE